MRHLTPLAILIGSVIIAFGLYFGLRTDTNSPRDRPPPASEPLPQPAPLPPAQPRIVPEQKTRVATEAKAALEAQKAAIVAQCLATPLNDGKPPYVDYVFNFTFGANGQMLARGVSEDRETGRPAVTKCVLGALLPVIVSPPGQSVYVEVDFRLQ